MEEHNATAKTEITGNSTFGNEKIKQKQNNSDEWNEEMRTVLLEKVNASSSNRSQQ